MSNEIGWLTEGEVGDVGEDVAYADVVGRRLPARVPVRQPVQAQTRMPARLPDWALRPALGPAQPSPSGITESRVREIVADEIRQRLPAGRIPPAPIADAMLPMGLGRALITPTVSVVTLTARPQRAFRGERLVLNLTPDGGASQADADSCILESFRIGDQEQLVGGAALPCRVFASDAFGVRLLLSGATAGVDVSLRIAYPGTLGSGSIAVTGAIIGRGDASAGNV